MSRLIKIHTSVQQCRAMQVYNNEILILPELYYCYIPCHASVQLRNKQYIKHRRYMCLVNYKLMKQIKINY